MPINRKSAIKSWINELGSAIKSLKMVQDIPINTPVDLTIMIWEDDTDSKKWRQVEVSCVCIVTTKSLVCEKIALEEGLENRQGHLKCSAIKRWKLFNKKDLPLLVGYKHTYPLLDKLLKE